MNARHDLLRRSKWRWRYVRKQTNRRARSWMVTLPAARSASRALWICSWQRSGSTWLAELLSTSPHFRLIYEPANLNQQLFDGNAAAIAPLPTSGDPALDDVLDALRGGARAVWTNQLNHAHVESHRVVKDVRALALAGEVRDALPATPIVVLVRHPIAVARSVVDLGWGVDDNPESAFDREVGRWCELHHDALRDARLSDAYFISYEALRLNPAKEIQSILNYAATFDPSWRRVRIDQLTPDQPSATNFRHSTVSGDEDGEWRDLPVTFVTRAVAKLERSGLRELYDERTSCNADVNEFASRMRALGDQP